MHEKIKSDIIEVEVKEDFFAQFGIESGREMLRYMAAKFRSEGATWLTATELKEHGICVLQGWKVRPAVEMSPHPMLSPAPPASDQGNRG